ncbi:serine hydrolase [Gilvibacter sp.]|uniref:serine hydrolase domain-containing protein n=1 Tax=Gilvibacter sp. TaxID=2729997 RepID=UPI0025C677E0|nr:serine hydrolase [Gilvibacter sp.]NQX76250.1 serine hydrolase [Gilvibacter sp.]
MKTLVRFFKGFLALILALIALLYITDYEYIIKGVRVVYMTGHTTAFIDDHVYFENETIAKSDTPWEWPKHQDYNTVAATETLKQTNEALGTVAFAIIKNDSLWYENYAEGYSASSQTNSFSMAKSITTALLGKAIKDGYIKSLDQPIGDFFDKYKDDKTTVGDLSSMASGLDWEESYKSPFSVTARAYYDDDLAETILAQEVVDTPGAGFRYLSGNTQLLGMIIQEATGKSLSEYLEISFWQPLGMQQDALWQIDDAENRLAKSYCCIASNALDFARFGRLFKNQGNWNGKQILDSAFVAKATVARFQGEPYGYGFWISDHMDKHIFVMRGILGQYVITIPEDDLIIVRLGHQLGSRQAGDDFTSDFYKYVEEAYAMIGN